MTANEGSRPVSRETSHSASGWPNDPDTPIGAAAERAMQVLHTNGTLPRPVERRVFTIANQKVGWARRPPPSTSRLRWRCTGSRFW